ncbi:MAG: DUF115 domain-containing protein [Bacteroidales bacterium]|nr:DUF115 domain-containing protein [Lachnoclostridium sp.]MCM1383920.1 DUF115 domain-containing protein [Lachnoclostridium sp.]MCM1464629.1 DUF115 domain-containing protein [Bacteroidales bacterium]
MAEAFLEEIYQDARLICELKEVVQYARMNITNNLATKGDILLKKLCDVCKRYAQYDVVKAKEMWRLLKEVSSLGHNPILIGDILECKILPLLEDSMRQWGDICTENDEGDYRFETSISGFLTLKDERQDFYFHSTVDPMWEAKQLAECIYDPRNKQYSIRGCGLGYLIYQLYEVSQGSLLLNVYEKDARMVQYARQYGVLDWVPEKNLKVVIDEDPRPFLTSALEDNTGMYMFAPAFRSEADDVRESMNPIEIDYATYYLQRKNAAINYWNNLRADGKMIWEFDASQLKKDFIVIAGGPSVDDNMEFLRENQGKKTLIAVGTVFKKLIQNNITPDIVAILEPDPAVYPQLEGMEDQKVPLLVSLLTYWKLAAAYQGETYFVPLTGMAGAIGYPLDEYEDQWAVGGTVTNMAIIAAIRFGAERIYLVGVDMAYPNGVTHAEGTAQRQIVSLEGMIPLEGVDGSMVYTDKIMKVYKGEVEELISQVPRISFYNMSRIGAKLEGTLAYDESIGV